MPKLQERHDSLWILAAAPAIWTGYFLACYVTAAVWCAKVAGRAGELDLVRTLIAAYTVVALAGIVLVLWRGYRRQRLGETGPPHAADTPLDRFRFLGFAAMLLSGLSIAATIYVALAVVFIDTCH